ncbi:MAG: ATP synthase subunit I [Pyrinomonadaceae bacterium]
MGEDIDPLTTGNEPKPIRHGSILAAMAGLVAVMAVVGFITRGTSFGFGVVFGGVLSLANYLWLDSSTRAIFRQDASSAASWLAVKYLLRYVAIGVVLSLVYFTGAFPVPAVLLGLAAFALAVVLQGLKNIFTSSF